jgi:two-component SAPR family response regulator
VDAFEAALKEGRRHLHQDPAGSTWPDDVIRSLENAVALYHGDFADGMAGGEWIEVRREELRRKYLDMRLMLGRLQFDAGRLGRAIETYQQALAKEEYLEAAHRELMRCYAQQGDHGRASGSTTRSCRR